MSNQAIDVEILGKMTRVNCPAGQEESLITAAKDLDRRLKNHVKEHPNHVKAEKERRGLYTNPLCRSAC